MLSEKKHYIIANQLLKCGTSIGANIREAQNAESKLDFIHKIKIAAKEAEETEYWLLVCSKTIDIITEGLLNEIVKIKKIINKIVGTKNKKYRIKPLAN